MCLHACLLVLRVAKLELLCRLICHGPNYRVEVYWTCQQPKCGVRCKESGKSLFCYTSESFTVLIELCNEMATCLNTPIYCCLMYASSIGLRASCPLIQVLFFEKNGAQQKWEQVNYKANSVLMNLRLKYRKELKANLI